MSLQAVISTARAELGVTESPAGSNRVKYWDLFGPEWQGQPWCCAFLAWVFQRAGERMAFFGGGKTASCTILLRWYREQGLTVPVSEVQKGDIVLLNFNGKGTPDHCGLAELVNYADSPQNVCVWTIEGNTTPGYEGSQDNGGCVASKLRFGNQIVAVCRPQYKPEEITDDWSGHHAADAIRWGKEIGLVKGYTDGTMRPDEPVPLWRLLTILKRYDDYRFGGSGK